MIKLVAYTTQQIGSEIKICNSEGDVIVSSNIHKLLEFLNEPYQEDDAVKFCIKVFWDMDESLSVLLRLIGLAGCKEIAGPTHSYQLTEKMSLFLIHSKVFSLHAKEYDAIKKKEKTVSSYFYHVAQYYPDDPEPEDAFDVHAAAKLVMEALESMDLHPKKLTSPVAIYEAEVLSRMTIPTVANIPGKHEELIDMAEDCLGRLWIQVYQCGHFDIGEVFEFDIRSCYPSIAMKLRSLQYAKFAKSHTIDENADWGFLRGEVTIYDHVKVSPIFYDYDVHTSQRTGTWPTTITLHDYRFIKHYGIGEFKLDVGYFIKFTAPVYPMETMVKKVFHQRGMGGLISDLAKRMAAGGFYGKFLEKHDDGTFGKIYNPIYAAMINSLANIQVAEFIYKNELQDDLIHVGVDSVIATKDAELKDQRRVSMGDWRFTGIGPVLVLSSGRVYHGKKKPQGLNYDAIMAMINAQPRESYYTANLKRRQTLEECITLGDLTGLGKFKDTTSSIDLNLLRTPTDRLFKDYPHTGAELLKNKYGSEPLKAEGILEKVI